MLTHMRKHQPHALVTDAVAPIESERCSCGVPGLLQRAGIVVVPKPANKGLCEEGMALSECPDVPVNILTIGVEMIMDLFCYRFANALNGL